MTLRQLLREFTYKQAFNLIHKLFFKHKVLDHETIIDADLCMHSLFMRFKNFPVNKNDRYKIYFTQDLNDKVDLLILDKSEDEMLDFHTFGRADLIDLEIYKAFKIEDLTCLAYILYEHHSQKVNGKNINLWEPKHPINDDFQK